MGRLIVIEGLDGSGKTTQTERVAAELRSRGEKVRVISYPDYQNPSSMLVRMYLNGELSARAEEVNAYAASSFYAVDRYASYLQDWKSFYEEGGLLLATRYVGSNAIHQMGKLPESEWEGFLAWLEDYEYGKLGLPRPDQVIFLDMPQEASDYLLNLRYQGDPALRDLHERDAAYLERCRKTASYAAERLGWSVVLCGKGGRPFPLEEVTRRILEALFG